VKQVLCFLLFASSDSELQSAMAGAGHCLQGMGNCPNPILEGLQSWGTLSWDGWGEHRSYSEACSEALGCLGTMLHTHVLSARCARTTASQSGKRMRGEYTEACSAGSSVRAGPSSAAMCALV